MAQSRFLAVLQPGRVLPPLQHCTIAVVALGLTACANARSVAVPTAAVTHMVSRSALLYGRRLKPADTQWVDVRNYMAAFIGDTTNPQMLCLSSPNEQVCHTSVRDGGPGGEIKIIYSSGIVDYIGITSAAHQNPPGGGTEYYIGVIRNRESASGPLRCFATAGEGCTAPAGSYFMPEGVPYRIASVPIVSWDAVESASNSDGWSPRSPIAGELITTPSSQNNDHWLFDDRTMDPSTCSQWKAFEADSKVGIAYVKNVPFGGTVGPYVGSPVGTQDAIVVDTFGVNSDPGQPSTAERYFYVKGLGRVEESNAKSYNGPPYTLNPQYTLWNVERGLISSIVNPDPTPQCPQGSAWPLWGN